MGVDREALRAGKGFAQAMVWNEREALKVMVVDKADFSRRRVFEMPAYMVFHFGNAWEADNVIRVDFRERNRAFQAGMKFCGKSALGLAAIDGDRRKFRFDE